jgi:hypothetical protein
LLVTTKELLNSGGFLGGVVEQEHRRGSEGYILRKQSNPTQSTMNYGQWVINDEPYIIYNELWTTNDEQK